VSVSLTPSARRELRAVSAEFGMTQVSLLSRLVERFVTMPKSAQAALLGFLPRELEPQVVRQMLKHLSEQKHE
jgi:hypothetical protein